MLTVLSRWLSPASQDKEVAFRERLVRYGVGIILLVNAFSLLFSLAATGDVLGNLLIHLPIFAVEIFAGYMVSQGRVTLGGQLIVLQILGAQAIYLVYTRYTHNTMSYFLGPMSFTFAVLMASTLLPPKQIMVFTYIIIGAFLAAVFYPLPVDWDAAIGHNVWVFSIWVSAILLFEGLLLSFLMRESERRYYSEQKANQAKSEFLRHVNHELRTPLNSIVPLIQMTLESKDPLTDKQKKRLLRIKHGADYLFNLVASILNFSKIESGILDQNRKDTDLNLLLEDCITIIRPQVQPDVVIKTELAQTLMLNVDQTQMSEVFVNILSNAAKFTSSGYIRIRSSVQSQFVIIQIEDTGIGITDESKVFEWFGQTLAGKAKRGSGLGMPIAKSLVEAHGGKMYFETCVGKGTSFFVELPRKATL